MTSIIHPSSSIIVFKRQPKRIPDFKILMAKRLQTSKSFPGVHVFPGGVVDKTDLNREKWKQVFSEEQLQLKDFSSRLCSIRELFEETNILLSDKKYHYPSPANQSDDGNWFLEYCLKHNITPSVEKLIPYSRWITPEAKVKTMRRFDTMFYIYELEDGENYEVIPNLDELSSIDWFTPNDILSNVNAGKANLIVPTFVTLSQLDRFEKFEDIVNFALRKKIIPLLPYLSNKSDEGYTFILPGDSEHPEHSNEATEMRVILEKNGRIHLSDSLKEI